MGSRRALTLICIGVLLLAWLGAGGCATVDIPVHERPEVTEKATWSSVSAEYGVELEWWRAYQDPTLDEFVSRAIAGNLSLGVLAARTEQARAQIGQAQALRMPVINAGTRTDTTDITGLGTTNKYGTGMDLVWELDVWGKARQGVEAQRSGYQASVADWRAGYLMIVAGVADTYFQIRQIDLQRRRQRQALAQNERILELYQRLHARGMGTSEQVSRQEAEVQGMTVMLHGLERARALAENALAALVGTAPGTFHVDDTSERGAVMVPEVPAGLPSDLLARRPDLLAAEYRLRQQVNLEAQARLGQLPTVGLTGLGGSASYGLKGLLDSWTGGLSSVVQFPVFDPNVRARIRASEAQVEVAEAEYRAAVMQAFEEVERVLITLESRRRQRQAMLTQCRKLREAQRVVERRLEAGLVSQLEVLEQERSLLSAELSLIENDWQIASATVSLFKAVGGGWPPEDPASGVAANP